MHRYKGVGFRSKEGGGDSAKIRAVDLHQKLTHMHRESAAHGGRPTVTGATGTPLTNSISEQYTMVALISPWVLEEFGVAGPDLWAETFGQKVQRIEMAPDGSGLKVVERFSLLDRQRLSGLDEEIALLTEQQAVGDLGGRIEHARRRVELLDDVVAAVVQRDKLAEQDAARLTLQAKVDSAVEQLERFDAPEQAVLVPERAMVAAAVDDCGIDMF